MRAAGYQRPALAVSARRRGPRSGSQAAALNGQGIGTGLVISFAHGAGPEGTPRTPPPIDRDAVSPQGESAYVLVLTRKTNESIMIGNEIEISVLSVSGDKVRIGIAAPRDVGVFRKEVYAAPGEGDDGESPAADEDRPGG